ncbi:hypothetical protein JCM9279_005877 [Rhodotorula babjevae]
MSAEWDKTCLVCGVKTENRCSSCAKAGIDLFFCSPDYQKLVCKAYRRVCGPGKADPFMWPLLSQLEADEIIEHMHDSTGLYAQPTVLGNSLAGAMHTSSGLEPEEIAACARALTAGVADDKGDTLMALQSVLGDFRALDVTRQTRTQADEKASLVPYHSPIATLSFDEVTSGRPDRLNPEPWRTKFRHLSLVNASLLGLWDRTAGQEPPVEWLERSIERLNNYVRIEIEPTHPHVAKKLLMEEPPSEMLANRLAVFGGAAA